MKTLLCKSIVSLFVFFVFIGHTRTIYKNEELTTDAWKHYNEGNYSLAIEKAKECIIEYQQTAKDEQQELLNNSIPEPPVGKVVEKEKQNIFKRGLLNDVATCWYIIGISDVKLHNKKAIDAFKKVLDYPYARTYDPGWDGFWSPSEKAKEYIKSIENGL